MRKKLKPDPAPEPREWYVSARITLRVDVRVQAADASEAMANAEAGDFDYEHNQCELTDWVMTGKPVENL